MPPAGVQIQTDRSSPLRGALLMAAGVLALASMDAVAKALVSGISVPQMLGLRALVILPLLLAALPFNGGLAALRTGNPLGHVLRVLAGIATAFAFFTALKTLQLADATVIAFSTVIFMTVLSVPLLKERVGFRRMAAVCTGFIGVIIVMAPAGDAEPAMLLALMAAIPYALTNNATRWLGRRENTFSLVFYMNLGVALASWALMPWSWTPPAPAQLAGIAAMALLGLSGHVLMVRAYKSGAIAMIAPIEYTALLWASLFGYMFWGDIPALHVWSGGAVIIASCLYVFHRETRRRHI